MKIILIVILLTLSNLTTAKEIKFATFNTYWLYDDKPPHKRWWDKMRGSKGQSYKEAIKRARRVIMDIDADVIALQEIENEKVFQDLFHGLGYTSGWMSKTKDNITGQNVAIFSKFPHYKGGHGFTSSGESEGYFTTDNEEKRTIISKLLWVDINVDGRKVTLVNTHLKSQLGGDNADHQRVAQASILRRITLPQIERRNHIVLMGDFNDGIGSPTLKRIRGMDDYNHDLVQPAISSRFHGEKWTYEYRGKKSMLDHILLSPALKKKFVKGWVHRVDKSTSDHSAVVVVLDL